jgi:hypothetical protein
MKKTKFDIGGYLEKQAEVMRNDPLNRHATRVEHSCPDEVLDAHPELLDKHFVENGGPEAFRAENRHRFVTEVEVPDNELGGPNNPQ